MKPPTRLDYQNVKLIPCPACGVEIAEDVLEEHTKSVLCSTKTLAKQAELSGLVRCEDAIFEQMSGTGARVVMLKTRAKPHDAQIRSISGFNAVEEQWADRIAVELMRQPGRTMDERVAAVEKYVKWRKRYPNAKVDIPTETTRRDLPCNHRDTGISFHNGRVAYDGSFKYKAAI